MSHFRTSVTTLEPDLRTLCAAQLTERPGTSPTITIPMVPGRRPDADLVWRHLREPAEFFAIRMPTAGDVAAALSAFAAGLPDATSAPLIAASVTLVEADGDPQILVSGAAVRPLRAEPVRIAGDQSVRHAHRASDPWWQRMAARTVSRADVDQCERWLNGRGYADGLSDGEPLLGALVFQASGGCVGVENAEPTSVLDQLAACGAVAPISRIDAPSPDADRVWWVSPRYETHPVAELDGKAWPVDVETVPAFARWS
ncbi:hypothetical protein TUM20983_29560 [Mycobacterium antarcticum]|uniref:hypothetical protein n=1 Tax=Mycolicibacterium sp. TUM20983 TaxID=3023369 RepID=UPI002385FA5C|nr:hypothetical protein [Mycolicibacterium sp. TUM20983]GLP75846.1 hypothetical protein TUM20983_29560 [Mycolicibacterium sp. TUM20983]